MSKKKQKTNSSRNDSMKIQVMLQYTISVIAAAALIGGAGVLSWAVCTSRIWYGTEKLYPVLTGIKRYLVIVNAFLCMACSMLLAYYFIAKPFRYLDAVVQASGQLAHPSEDAIVLPPAVHSVQDELNMLRERALRNAMIAKEAEQRKNDLIVYLAHDLKTPLTSVIGYLALMQDEPHISQYLRERYTGIVLDKAQRLEDLINEFFDITRFNLTTLTLEKESVNLSRMLEQIASEFEPVLAEKGLYWQTEIAPGIELLCDPDKLQRVFDNLIRNAVNYSYADTEILLTMTAEEHTVRIYIKNHGRTIPPEKLGHIFEQFFRVDSSRASATGGAGLGLAIAKEIVELHGGRVWAQSQEESVAFTVEIPGGGKQKHAAG